MIRVCGRKPRRKPSAFTMEWAGLVRRKMAAKSLVSPKVETFLKCISAARPEQPQESIADWTVTTYVGQDAIPAIRDMTGVWELLRVVSNMKYIPPVPVSVMPTQAAVFKKYFLSEAGTLKHNLRTEQALNKEVMGAEPLFAKDIKVYSGSLSNNVKRLTLEKKYRSQTGFFGYDEHELINRRIISYREMGEYLYVAQGVHSADLLGAADPGKPVLVRPAVTKLINRAPKGVNTMELLVDPDALLEVVDLVAGLETLVHRETTDYLAQVGKTMAAASLSRESLAELTMKMPPYVMSVNKDSRTGALFAVFPGGITYPRPKVAPAVVALLSDFRRKANSVGGIACYARAMPGCLELELVQSTESIGFLLKSSVNNFIRTYMKTPEGNEALGAILRGRYDAVVGESRVVLVNPLVATFKQGQQRPIRP